MEVQEKVNTNMGRYTKSEKNVGVLLQNTHTIWNTKRISRIRRILGQKCGPDPPFHTRRGPGHGEQFWGSLWGALGATLGDLGTLWAHLGATLGRLGSRAGDLGIFQGDFGNLIVPEYRF